MASKPVKKIRKNGDIRWESTVSLGYHPVTGKRMQTVVTRATEVECLAEAARIGAEVFRGEYQRPEDAVVPEIIDSYIRHATYDMSDTGGRLSYPRILLPAREYFARMRAKDVKRTDIECFRDWLQRSGRRRGSAPLAPRTVNFALYLLERAFDLAVSDGIVSRNPCANVKRVPVPRRQYTTWDEAQFRRFAAAAAGDRLQAVWMLAMLGLRRGELLGARWADIRDGCLHIRNTRVQGRRGVVEKGPKTGNGYRVLPLPGAVADALKALRRTQAEEKLRAGARYADSGYLATDQLGRPVRLAMLDIWFHRLAGQAGLPRIRLHDLRHSSTTILDELGVPTRLRGQWHGHTEGVSETVYTHRADPDLSPVTEAFNRIFGAA